MKFFKSKIFIFLIIELSLIIAFAKAYMINTFFIEHENTFFYGFTQSLFHDSIIFFFIFFFSYISYIKQIHYLVGIFLRIVSLFIFSLYISDIYILLNLANHLTFNDLIKYISYVPKYLTQNYSFNLMQLCLLISILLFSIQFLFIKYEIKKIKTHIYTILALTSFLIFNLFAQNGRYIHSWIYKNFILYNYEIYDQSKKYSEKFIKNIKNNENKQCKKSENNTPNIIILMVESLASYQSDFFSGIKNWTPNLDNIAKDNISFTNFYANGFVTEDAEIAIITGELPIYAPKAYSNGGGVSFDGFYNIEHSLPNILKKYNYKSEFITSSDLKFSNTGEWAKSNGFNYIEGSNHKDYINKPRYHFEAAADEYLYKRVLNRIKKQDSNYFLFIKTVSSHAPFVNPDNDSNSEEETIKYVDKQIGLFYKKLKEKKFFEKGILIIVGDHHPVIPLKNEEIKKFGQYKASSIIPAIAVYKDKKILIKENFQQTDIYNTIKNHVFNESCISKWYGDFLNSEIKAPKYIFHRRGDQRGIISVFSNEIDFNVKLNGNMTKIINSNKNDEVINRINYIRIKRLKEEYKDSNTIN